MDITVDDLNYSLQPSIYGKFTYIWLIFMVNLGKYSSPMDAMGYTTTIYQRMFSTFFWGWFIAAK